MLFSTKFSFAFFFKSLEILDTMFLRTKMEYLAKILLPKLRFPMTLLTKSWKKFWKEDTKGECSSSPM